MPLALSTTARAPGGSNRVRSCCLMELAASRRAFAEAVRCAAAAVVFVLTGVDDDAAAGDTDHGRKRRFFSTSVSFASKAVLETELI